MNMISRFRGCLVGTLVGDCLGSPFEGDAKVSSKVLSSYITHLLGKSQQKFSYTDDTAMTISIAKSLVENAKVEPVDLAKRFVSEYYHAPKRGYGENVVRVFEVLRESEFKDVYLPAKLQFDGSGSYGNGGAMRIAPIALFSHNKDFDYLKNAAEACTRLTHTHKHGLNGAMLQCLAVSQALKQKSDELDPVDFIEKLEQTMISVENQDDNPVYCNSLKEIVEIHQQKRELSSKTIADLLGNSVAAHQSVPTAIYSFLRGLKPLEKLQSDNPFVRTIYTAISVGGDTDTIAAMAGSIAGAFHGIEAIPKELQDRCESIEEITRLADELYKVSEEV